MDSFDFNLTREQPTTLTGVNKYIISDFESRITTIVKELQNLKEVKNKSGRLEIIERINQLYKGDTI